MSLSSSLYQVYCYVPPGHAEAVMDAIFAAGAGSIGAYDHCAWTGMGAGRFRPLEGATPFLGAQGTLHQEPEVKVECVCPAELLSPVLEALVGAHPYEEPAYGAIPVLTLPRPSGEAGRVEAGGRETVSPAGETGELRTPGDLDIYRNALLYQELHEDFTEDLDFHCRLLAGRPGPVLELGAGNARVGRALAASGHQVWALDLVETILDLGVQEAAAQGTVLHKVVADMRDFTIPGPGGAPLQFSAIICPLNTLSHLLTRKDLLGCLSSVARHLAPGAWFVPSMFVPDPAFLYRDPEALRLVDSFHSPSRGVHMDLYEKNTFHPVSQINHLTWIFQPDDDDSDPVVESYRLKVWHPVEFRSVLEEAGFRPVEGWADYAHRIANDDPGAWPDDTIMQTLVWTHGGQA